MLSKEFIASVMPSYVHYTLERKSNKEEIELWKIRTHSFLLKIVKLNCAQEAAQIRKHTKEHINQANTNLATRFCFFLIIFRARDLVCSFVHSFIDAYLVCKALTAANDGGRCNSLNSSVRIFKSLCDHPLLATCGPQLTPGSSNINNTHTSM